MDNREARVDSRDLAVSFGRRHHNVLALIDKVIGQCPAAVAHFKIEQHPVIAGLGGTRYCRHALIDREGFMLLAMSFPSTMREKALAFALTFADSV